MDKITGISVFVQVADSGSYVAAGKALGQTASAVGKAIVRLEEQLGVRLFHRNTRSISLTAEGARFLERCRAIMKEIVAAEQDLALSREKPRGKLRISAPLVSASWEAIFLEFMAAFPDIELELSFTNRNVDLIEEGFEATLRIGAREDTKLRARRLGAFRLLLVASPAYLARRSTPTSLDDLSAHDCLRGRNASSCKLYPWPLGPQSVRRSEQLTNRLVADHNAMLLSATLQGHGIACIPAFWVNQYVASGDLRILLEAETRNSRDVSALWPEGASSPKLAAFVEFMADRLPAILDDQAAIRRDAEEQHQSSFTPRASDTRCL